MPLFGWVTKISILFSGVGGTIIQWAGTSERVYENLIIVVWWISGK